MNCPNCSAQVNEGIHICPICQASTHVRTERLSSLAVTSFVLGILGIGLWVLLAVAGCAAGFLAYTFIERSGGALKGRPFAIAGVLLSAAGIARHFWLR
ncbi:MAG: DUF4190 domain-containing protein [Phycisphaerae bacterium]|nr:DUF4190 domain-containing protein [Phycisphaerae bacterium]